MMATMTGIISRPVRLKFAAGRLFVVGVTVATAVSVAACAGQTTGQKGATAGAVLGTGIAMVTGAGLATTIGAGLIGGAAGYLGGEAIESRK